MAFFDKIKSPLFLKEESDASTYIENLESLKMKAKGDLLEEIEKELKIASVGLYGENNVAFELKNCPMGIYVLRDIHISVDDLSAQIDFIVVTRKFTLLIECKNLIGDIRIDNQGNFIRSYEYKRKQIKEGIYSPVTQNQRHLDVLKRARLSEQTNMLKKIAIEKYFDKNYYSVIVLANPKTILNDYYAPTDIKSKVIRADQLNQYILNLYKYSKEPNLSEKAMGDHAQMLLNYHEPNNTDYLKKYRDILEKQEKEEAHFVNEYKSFLKETSQIIEPIDESIFKNDVPIPQPIRPTFNEDEFKEVYEKLRLYRLERSKQEGKKAYEICTNKHLEDLINSFPLDLNEMIEVKGFSQHKINLYGQDMLTILHQYLPPHV